MFALEIEYINGVSYASSINNLNEPEWPPHPDRVFLALVASWGDSDKDTEEADALRWLESQDPPELFFSEYDIRPNVTRFVPTTGNMEKLSNVFNDPIPIPDIIGGVTRKSRSFPAVILPDNSTKIYIVWQNSEPANDIRDKIASIVSRVSHIGHSSSLVRVSPATSIDNTLANRCVNDDGKGTEFLRCPSKGRFDELTSEFGCCASEESEYFQWRPSIAPTRKYKQHSKSLIQSTMGDEWTVLACKGEFVPVTESFPIIAKKMRDAIMSHINEPIHKVISGHNSDQSSLQIPHLAIIPMANMGWKHSDGKLLGIALVLPRKSSYEAHAPERRQMLQAVSKFLDQKEFETTDKTKHVGLLKIGSLGQMYFERDDGSRHSLDPRRYVGKSKDWSSITPIVLDKYPKKKKSPESIIAQSCINIGLPKPQRIAVSRYSNIAGVSNAYWSKGNNKGWKSPKPKLFENRFICHATISFDEEVGGPLIVGAGRYYGMGLCMKQSDTVNY